MARSKPQPLSAANVQKLLQKDLDAAKAKRAAKSADRKAAKAAKQVADAEAAAQAQAAQAAKAHAANPDVVTAQRVDYDALVEAGQIDPEQVTFDAYLADQGIAPDGSVLEKATKPHDAKTPYNGPMIALKTARKTYVKAANGILCNGSPLALFLGAYSRDVVVKGLIAALKLPGNPYLALNPGQQSMNLRNRARQAMIRGDLAMAEVEACVKEAAAPAKAE